MWGGVVLALSLGSRVVGGLDKLLMVNSVRLSGSSKVVFKRKALAAPPSTNSESGLRICRGRQYLVLVCSVLSA